MRMPTIITHFTITLRRIVFIISSILVLMYWSNVDKDKGFQFVSDIRQKNNVKNTLAVISQ